MNAFNINEIQPDSDLVIFRGTIGGLGVDKSQIGLFRAVNITTKKGLQSLKFEVNAKIERLDSKMNKVLEKLDQLVAQK
jgi:hypothetical protein